MWNGRAFKLCDEKFAGRNWEIFSQREAGTRDKDGHYWPIPYRNLGAPPISLWEQREAMSKLINGK
jgi:hypothetical protein